MNTRWILVADASRARLFREDEKSDRYEVVESFDHAASRSRARDLMADTNGRKGAGPSGGAVHGAGRVGVAPDTDPKEVEAQKFARELAHFLEAQLNQHAYGKVILVAPPHFLGLLKGCVSKQVERHIETTLHKDLTHLDSAAVREHVAKVQQT